MFQGCPPRVQFPLAFLCVAGSGCLKEAIYFPMRPIEMSDPPRVSRHRLILTHIGITNFACSALPSKRVFSTLRLSSTTVVHHQPSLSIIVHHCPSSIIMYELSNNIFMSLFHIGLYLLYFATDSSYAIACGFI